MIVVSDTSPLNYLILVGQDAVLPALFSRVVAPPAVIREMHHIRAPAAVRVWAASPPAWLEVRSPSRPLEKIPKLGQGELEAICLAEEIHADTVLIDERAALSIALRRGHVVTGTLGVLDLAAERGLLDLPNVIAKLRQTTFRCPDRLYSELLDREAARRLAKRGDG